MAEQCTALNTTIDGGGSVLRIKVQLPMPAAPMYDGAAEKIRNIFFEAFDRNSEKFRHHSSTPVQHVNGHYEFVVEVFPFADPFQDLFLLVRLFLHRCKFTLLLRRDMMPNIFVASPLFFTPDCIPAHEEVPIQSLYFGNILNGGCIGVHWTIEFGHRPRLRSDVMKATFEYVHGNKQQPSGAEGGELHQSTHTRLIPLPLAQFQLQSVRRVIVDPLCKMTAESTTTKKRIHFEVNCPPELRSYIEGNKAKPENRFGDGARNYFLRRGQEPSPMARGHSEYPSSSAFSDSTLISIELPDDHNEMLLYEIVSRLRRRSGLSIEFGCYDLINMHIGVGRRVALIDEDLYIRRTDPYVRDATTCEAFTERVKWASPVVKPRKLGEEPAPPPSDVDLKFPPGQFRLRFLIETIISRGSKVKDQLLVSTAIWTRFCDFVCHQYAADPEITIQALELFISKIEEMQLKVSLFRLLLDSFRATKDDQAARALSFTTRMKDDGYIRVRKVVLTPTRKIYIAPERLMGNRVLRKHDKDETQIIRIQFRDDDTRKLRGNTTGEKMMNNTVNRVLEEGIIIGGRNYRYLGSSNSQMRDSGCYFIFDPEPTYMMSSSGEKVWRPSPRVIKVRANLGKFENCKNVPKFMARFGQCFTQSKATNMGLPDKTSDFAYDVVGGDGGDGEPYQFSDGVGPASGAFLKMIFDEMQISPAMPSCIQFRHRGYKGVLSYDPLLDERNGLLGRLKLLGTKDADDAEILYYNCRFRGSQCKFEAARSKEFEVVKYAAPTPVSLNKPFINILDQVSEMQSLASHTRLCNRVEELLGRQLRSCAETLVREKHARDKLKELPRRAAIDILRRESGFCVTTEPYFRSLLKASVRFLIQKQLNKEQIQIPLHLGRSMFGVCDETGRLQYGQIFFQYHESISEKTPKPGSRKLIHVGPVLMTKNPCIVGGDVRMFEAVDIPELHHIVDVVVFPQHGPRSHPDEMAGSDLDGDEYTVIWDTDLFFDRNEKAMKFPKAPACKMLINPEELDKDLRNFYVKYLTQDSVGTISNAHLVNSDIWGINAEVCMNIAHKNAEALDFPKTGEPPDPLEKTWKEDLPPEQPERKPDFMQKFRDPCYASSRLIGRVYREINYLNEVLTISEEKDQTTTIALDPQIVWPGWEEYAEKAEKALRSYNKDVLSVMENYGIVSEGELMSGCIMNMRNSLSDREADDMSFFNTNQVIETQMTQIVRVFREAFFEVPISDLPPSFSLQEFGGWRACTENAPDMRFHDEENIFHRVVSDAACSDEVRRKAVACYRVCYTIASEQRDSSPRLLSFAWVAFDVLALVKRDTMNLMSDFIAGVEPVDTLLSNHVVAYARSRREEFDQFMSKWTSGEGQGGEPVARYLSYYSDVPEVAFFFVSWARKENLFSRRFSEVHLLLLLIQFALGHYESQERVISLVLPGTLPLPLDSRPGVRDIGQLTLAFLRFLASRLFERQTSLSFWEPGLGVDCVFMRGEWNLVYKTAVKVYYDFVFSLRIDLPIVDEIVADPPLVVREMVPFVVELPEGIDDSWVAQCIKMQTGAMEVKLRRMHGRDSVRVNVCAAGPLASHSAIRDLLIVPLSIKSTQSARQMTDSVPQLVYERVMAGAQRVAASQGRPLKRLVR